MVIPKFGSRGPLPIHDMGTLQLIFRVDRTYNYIHIQYIVVQLVGSPSHLKRFEEQQGNPNTCDVAQISLLKIKQMLQAAPTKGTAHLFAGMLTR